MAFVTVHHFSKASQATLVARHWSTALVFMYLWLEVNLVCCLLELPDFSDDVRNLETKQANNHENLDGHFFFSLNSHDNTLRAYHSHLGEVDQVVFGVVRCSFLNESQVSEIHSQIGHTGRITAGGKITLTLCSCTACWLCWSATKLCPWTELTSSKLLSGFWTSPLMKPASAACQSMPLSRRKGFQGHN